MSEDYYAELDEQLEPARIDGWRHRLEQCLRFEVVRRALNIGAESSVIDLGCGTGRLFEYLKKWGVGSYLGIDQRQSVIRRGRRDFPDARFLHSDLYSSVVEEDGPVDFAVAIGTLVDGIPTASAVQRSDELRQLMARLDDLSTTGWALVVLNQDRLDENPVRSLEPCLTGASRRDIEVALDDLGFDAAIDERCLPTDIFVLKRRGAPTQSVLSRVAGDVPHQTVLDIAAEGGDGFDAADEVWFWGVTGRTERARRALSALPDDHHRKRLLAARLRNK